MVCRVRGKLRFALTHKGERGTLARLPSLICPSLVHDGGADCPESKLRAGMKDGFAHSLGSIFGVGVCVAGKRIRQ